MHDYFIGPGERSSPVYCTGRGWSIKRSYFRAAGSYQSAGSREQLSAGQCIARSVIRIE